MIVVDASALIELLLRTASAQVVRQKLIESGRSLHAPHLIDIEVTQVLRRYALTGEIEPERGKEALADLFAFPISRHAHDALLSRVWGLRNNLSAYDAVYLALAEALDASLLTHDQRLVTAARRHSLVRIL